MTICKMRIGRSDCSEYFLTHFQINIMLNQDYHCYAQTWCIAQLESSEWCSIDCVVVALATGYTNTV